MASVKAFNSLVQEFLVELSKAFPGEVELQVYANNFSMLTDLQPEKPLQVFSETYAPHFAKIHNQDPTVFDDVPTLFDTINVKALWDAASEGTRSALWKYMKTLAFFASTMSMLPPQMRSMIDTMTDNCMSQFDTGELDPSQLMNMLPQILGSMAGHKDL